MADSYTTIASLVKSEKALRAQVDVALKATNPLVTSGIAGSGNIPADFMAGGPRKATYQFHNPLDHSKLSVISDDINQQGEISGTSASEYDIVKHNVAMAYGYAQLAAMVTESDPAGQITSRLVEAWVEQYLKIMTATLKGVFAASSALTKATGVAFSAEAFSDAIIEAQSLKDERIPDFDAAIVSRAQKAVLKKANRNDYVAASDAKTQFDTFQGVQLIETNRVSGLGGVTLASRGSINWADRSLPNDMEIEKYQRAGNLGGAEALFARRSFSAMPAGFTWKGAARSGDDLATLLTELGKASNWGLIDTVTADMIGLHRLTFTA